MTTTPAGVSPLSSVPTALQNLTGHQIGYRPVYTACLDGRIPAHQIRGRWYVYSADLPKIARILGLKPGRLKSGVTSRTTSATAA